MSLNIFAYNHIIDKLSTIIKSNKEQIKGGNFFIKTYYGQGSYLLQKTKISDEGIPGLPVLIHYILYEDDLYKNDEQIQEVEKIVREHPKRIYRSPETDALYEKIFLWMSTKIKKELVW